MCVIFGKKTTVVVNRIGTKKVSLNAFNYSTNAQPPITFAFLKQCHAHNRCTYTCGSTLRRSTRRITFIHTTAIHTFFYSFLRFVDSGFPCKFHVILDEAKFICPPR